MYYDPSRYGNIKTTLQYERNIDILIKNNWFSKSFDNNIQQIKQTYGSISVTPHGNKCEYQSQKCLLKHVENQHNEICMRRINSFLKKDCASITLRKRFK